MSVSGRRVVLAFYGGIGVIALIGMGLVIWIVSSPIYERDQRNLSMVLANAYQKYRFDTKSWPDGTYDVTANFRTENPEMVDRVRKAEAEWGLVTEVVDPEGSPSLIVRYAKPKEVEFTYMLRKAKR